MTFPLRSASRAFLLAMIVALVADGLLAALTEITTVTGPSAGLWTWAVVHLIERGRWVMLALLLVAAAQWSTLSLPSAAPHDDDRAPWRLVGRAVIVVPLLWIAATWLVQALLYTLAGRWDVDGQVFLEVDYYRGLLVGYIPWLLAGGTTIAVSRHVG